MNNPIISFSVIVLSLAFVFLYVFPAYSSNQKSRDYVVSLAATLKESEKIRDRIDETKVSMAAIKQSELDQFEVFLPERVDTIRFANNIQSIARTNGIILSNIKIADGISETASSEATTAKQGLLRTISLDSKTNEAQGSEKRAAGVGSNKPTKYKATKATFVFATTYEKFHLFLNDLERSLGVIDLVSLSFSPISQDVNAVKGKIPPVLYQYSMEIETYSLR